MTPRTRNALIGAVIAVAVWEIWSLIRHLALDGSLIFENIGRAIPAALLGAISGYFITRLPSSKVSQLPAPHAQETTFSGDLALDPDDFPKHPKEKA
jgi:hypothetical protein